MNRRGGFTLIEVVVALAILCTGLVMLMETQFGTLTLFDDAQTQVTERMLLEWAIGEAERDAMTGSDAGDGDFGERYPDYSYSYTATQIREDEMPGLLHITVTVQGYDDSIEMVFFAYDGNQSDPGADTKINESKSKQRRR
jgi:prepilin-type N-terminal cleavage/methylation domain-containing protein